jgi:hypothetical protein
MRVVRCRTGWLATGYAARRIRREVVALAVRTSSAIASARINESSFYLNSTAPIKRAMRLHLEDANDVGAPLHFLVQPLQPLRSQA